MLIYRHVRSKTTKAVTLQERDAAIQRLRPICLKPKQTSIYPIMTKYKPTNTGYYNCLYISLKVSTMNSSH
jgi:hypothetical protein